MAFLPDLIGWTTKDPDEWQQAAAFFVSRAQQDGRTIPAWSGRYLYDHFGGHSEDAIDIYCYSPADDMSDAAEKSAPEEVVIHMHMSGPSLWCLIPVYGQPKDLPDKMDHTMLVAIDNPVHQNVLPVEVVSRHVLSPDEQMAPFMAQMCFLAHAVLVFKSQDEYMDTLQKRTMVALPPGHLVSPAFLMSQFEQMMEELLPAEGEEADAEMMAEEDIVHADDLSVDDDDPMGRFSPEEKVVICCAPISSLEELPLQSHPFLLRVQLETVFGSLTLCCNKAQLNVSTLEVGDLCYVTGILSADPAINHYAGGYGH